MRCLRRDRSIILLGSLEKSRANVLALLNDTSPDGNCAARARSRAASASSAPALASLIAGWRSSAAVMSDRNVSTAAVSRSTAMIGSVSRSIAIGSPLGRGRLALDGTACASSATDIIRASIIILGLGSLASRSLVPILKRSQGSPSQGDPTSHIIPRNRCIAGL